MSDEIRSMVLLLIAEAQEERPNAFVDDADLAEKLGIGVKDVQVHMDILEDQGFTRTANSMDGRSALLYPKGHLLVEKLREQGSGDEDMVVKGFE